MEETDFPNSFRVEVMGIVFDPKKRKILIAREENNPYLNKNLWRFPGGHASQGEKLEATLGKKIKENTGYKTENLGSVFVRIPPEKEDVILIYYLCEITGGKEKPGGNFRELKWVSPTELRSFFTTKIDPSLSEYINNLK